ncbi:DoxX family protein [bacterium]|nr:MAG: DoxX family protein [bacterium]
MTRAEQCKANGFKCCALSLVRVALGFIFFMHGAHKALGWFGGPGLEATLGMMTKNGMPAALAYMVIFGELLGGIALMAGFLSRFAALGIAVIMAGAIFTVHGKNGFFLQNQGFEYNLALISMALAVIVGGGGCLALDNFFCRKKAQGE